MKWLRLSNAGEFDVITAITMIGASVKVTDNPIGLYGSGAKYALAQALRQGIAVKIADKGKVYTLAGKPKTFRGEEFTMVALRSPTGKIHETGITSDFGKEDWKDLWFIFREFYSNMLDEDGICEVVDGVTPVEDGVSIFLPYSEFRQFYENLGDYFTQDDWEIRPGTGRVYKKGVFVGELDEECVFDIQSDSVQMTESRTVKMGSAWTVAGDLFEYCDDSELWKLLWESPNAHHSMHISMEWYQKGQIRSLSMHESLIAHYGEDYAICPNHEQMIKDAIQVYDLVPVVLPDNWTESKDCVKILDLIENVNLREPTEEEWEIVNKALAKIADFIREDTRMNLKISVSITDNGAGGTADLNGWDITISERALRMDCDRGTLNHTMRVLIHEINHLQTRAGDYDRGFAEGFQAYLVKLFI